LNLVVNARDASPSGGPIQVVLESEPGVARLAVKDHGVGIPDSVRAQLFRPFFTTKGSRGTGLGLVTVKSTAALHGGSISVESEPGGGSAFELRIPTSIGP
jgi:signal transduction histidine kinase